MDRAWFQRELVTLQDAEWLKVTDLAALSREVELRGRREELLSVTLLLIDKTRSEEVRSLAAREWTALFDEVPWIWVEGVLLSTLAPGAADFEGAAALVGALGDRFQTVGRVQPQIRAVVAEWEALAREESGVEAAGARAQAVREGWFRRRVLGRTAPSEARLERTPSVTPSVFPRLHPRLQAAIVSRLGWASLRPVQDISGPPLLDGHNAIILAPTAGGKTEASMFPVISMLIERTAPGVGALYIAPIKALLNNQAERLGIYTEMVGLRRFVWHGDITSSERRQFLADPTDLLMTTPESLEVMLMSQKVDPRLLLGGVDVVVIDEVHAIAGSDRGAHLMSVIERIVALREGRDVQRIGLSATIGNPKELLKWIQGSSTRPAVVIDPPKTPSRRELLVVHRENLSALAANAATTARDRKSLFFCQSRKMSESVADAMRACGTEVFVHHSAVSKEERLLAEIRFHRGTDVCIVCTSTLELGIDVGDLDKVLQAEAPETVGSFLQRMGRTGRRENQPANMTFFCQEAESVVQACALIALARKGWVESVQVDRRSWPVLVHQLLAMSLSTAGVTVESGWTHFGRVPDFSGIQRAEYDRLVEWLIRDGSLRVASGRLVIGPKAERRFGRRNFMELYAVFSSPQSYTVQHMERPIGTLGQAFVDRLVEGVSTFLLAGRAWQVDAIRHDDRVIRALPAPRGRQPSWGGMTPAFLGFELCQEIRHVLASDDVYPFLHLTAADVLAERREMLGEVARSEHGIEDIGDGLRWWTFAGGRTNTTLKYGLAAVGGDWKISVDNLALTVRGADRSGLNAARERLREPAFWKDQRLWKEIELPGYRLSKFQGLMPDWIEREMLATFLLDVEGARRWAAGD